MQENRIKLIKLPQVMQITTLSRATVYRLIAKGEFPKQIKLSERASAWIEHEVLEWLDNRINNRVLSTDQQKFIPKILSA
jgi:prophage regulatory protein